MLMRKSIVFSILMLPMALILCGCPGSSDVPPEEPLTSTVSIEDLIQPDPIDWSTVTPEQLWTDVSGFYADEGPGIALDYLDRGISGGVVTQFEANQVRAGFLYEIGRLDDAFVALLQYEIDENRPDLLRLRGDIIWGMGRFEEARHNYELLLETEGDNPSPGTLASLARLYDDLGDWESASNTQAQLEEVDPSGPSGILLEFYYAVLSQDPEYISTVADRWRQIGTTEPSEDSLLVFAEILEQELSGDRISALETARVFLTDGNYQPVIAMSALRLEMENAEFDLLESDIRRFLTGLDAIGWLDMPVDLWPQEAESPAEVAALLGWASGLELGRDNLGQARLLAERANSYVNSYDLGTIYQLAGITMLLQEFEESFGYLDEAYRISPPSDVRVRVRILQYAPLAPDDLELPWEFDAIADELQAILPHRMDRFPGSALYRAAAAELQAYRGNLENALTLIEGACALPGATREMQLRRGYYLARLDRLDEAMQVVEDSLSPGDPYLAWMNLVGMEALERNDPELASLALEARDYLAGPEQDSE